MPLPPQGDPASCTPVADHLRQLPALGVPFTKAMPPLEFVAVLKGVQTVEETETAVGEALEPVELATSVLAACEASEERAMLESVLLEPEIVLFVNICEAAIRAIVSLAAGT